MLRNLIRRLRSSPLADRLIARLLGRFTTWPADEFSRFTSTRIAAPGGLAPSALPPRAKPVRAPAPKSLSPGTFEVRFARLQREGRYHDMWSMLAEDAQRSWGGRNQFVAAMRAQAAEVQVLEALVGSIDIVPEWTDERHQRTYSNVARLAVRYRLRLDWRELTMDRQVHLIPAADGWRTLCYP